MSSNLLLAAVLCLTTWMTMVHATHAPVENCCIQLSNTKIPVERIVNYTIQSEGVCPVKAIIFETKLGKRLCSNPSSGWARKAMRKVDEEIKNKALQELGHNEDISTSDITPAASTATKKLKKNSPQKKGRNGRRRKGKKYRRGRRRLRKRI